MDDFEISEESKIRVKRALEYAVSEARKAYSRQRIPNSHDDIAEALREGIAISNEEGRFKIVSELLMSG